VANVEYMPWLYPLFTNPPKIEQGRLAPPPGPGLGLELDTDAAAKYRVAFSP
jgi:L-alanine-DL-glutamate epimerase-like enolase superfamily enzyme